MLLLSIHNAIRNRPLHLVTAKLDGADEELTAVAQAPQKRPLAVSVPNSRLTEDQTSSIGDVVGGFTIEDAAASKRRKKKVPMAAGPGGPRMAFQLDVAEPRAPALATAAGQALTKTRRRAAKHVGFSAVHIREHAITVGDHDWCEGSLPLELDWKHTPTRSIPLEDYEWQRQRQGRTPRGRLPKLDYQQRKRMLRRVYGITEEDLLLLERQRIDSKYVALHCSKTVTLFNKYSTGSNGC